MRKNKKQLNILFLATWTHQTKPTPSNNTNHRGCIQNPIKHPRLFFCENSRYIMIKQRGNRSPVEMVRFAKIVNDFLLLTTFAKSSILYISLCSE